MKTHLARMTSSLPMALASLALAACSAVPLGRTDAPGPIRVLPDAGTPIKPNVALAGGVRCLGEDSVESWKDLGAMHRPGTAPE